MIMKRILPIILALCLILCACKSQPDSAETTSATTAPVTTTSVATTAPATETTENAEATEATEAPVEVVLDPSGLHRNPLNGEILDEAYSGRVFAVTMNTVDQAMPYHGINQADVYFEMFVNGFATRGLALFTNVEDVESIGSIRSTRYNFTDLALAYDMILVHASASDEVLRDMYAEDVANLNADGDIGYRDSDRYNNRGYDWEHTLFAKGQSLADAAAKKGYDLEVTGKDYGMHFTEDGTPAKGEKASEIKIVLNHNGSTKTNYMKYDETLGKYIFWQFGDEQIDENTGERVNFENVIVMFATVEDIGQYHVADLYDSGDGYFACGGKIIPIKWSHENERDPIRFTLEDGTPLKQGVGSTYIAIAPLASSVTYE